MRALEVITGHYEKNEKQSIEVPEWGLTIHWQLLVVEDRTKLTKMAKDDVDILVARALDENGKKMFDLGDKEPLRKKADAAIISRVVAKMIGQTRITDADVEEAEKN